ncbi:MAG: hypothetical protein JST47_13875 [Bacteroidetes bacterium]|nr:hypothetical protein [Bacteroidota bacterium]MBS1974229.1 hypothetical protein [Bacteroidota bacterium]
MEQKSVILCAMLLSACFLDAQRVLYSPIINNRNLIHFEVAGKTSAYYWILKEENSRTKHYSLPQQNFEVYNSRLKLVNNDLLFPISANTKKEYLVASKYYFDRLLLLEDSGKTNLFLQRFSEDGSQYSTGKIVASFPFNEPGNSFLLLRSEDKSKILLLCFEFLPSSPPSLHTILFDSNWGQLLYKIYQHPFISQPIIQDDFVSYPIESFEGTPVQLANSGEWMMAAPSRTDNNFLLFHFCNDGSGFSFKEIKLPSSSELEDLALTINNARGEASAGLLSKFHYRALKNVQVVHYSLENQQFDFDSSYRFSTLSGNQLKNDNLVNERFVTVPGNGFILLKEYGRVFQEGADDIGWSPSSFFADNNFSNPVISSYDNSNGYTKFNKLVSMASEYQRGDLALFFFPAQKNDSCWSALISKQQITEMNSPNLSYVFFPEKEKLALLYNSFLNSGEDQYGSSTYIDKQGNILHDGGLAFWKFDLFLNFQQARQIDANEIAVPYKDNQRSGFAIIEF